MIQGRRGKQNQEVAADGSLTANAECRMQNAEVAREREAPPFCIVNSAFGPAEVLLAGRSDVRRVPCAGSVPPARLSAFCILHSAFCILHSLRPRRFLESGDERQSFFGRLAADLPHRA
jgi:hypothetical protein